MAVKIARIEKILNVVATPVIGGLLSPSTTYYGVVFAVESQGGYGVNEVCALSPQSDEFTFTTDAVNKCVDMTWDVPVNNNVTGAIQYCIMLTTTSGVYYNKPCYGNPLCYTYLITTNSHTVGAVAAFANMRSGYNLPFVMKSQVPTVKLGFGFEAIADEGLIRVYATGAFTLQDIKDQADADGLGDFVYYDGVSNFAIFGGMGWLNGDAGGYAYAYILDHNISFVCSSGMFCFDANVNLQFGEPTGTQGCNISNRAYYTVYDFYSLTKGSIVFSGCKIDTYKYQCFKGMGSGVVFFKSLLNFYMGLYSTSTPVIDNTLITRNGGTDQAYSGAYRKDMIFINCSIYFFTHSNMNEYINCKMFTDYSWHIEMRQALETYHQYIIDNEFYGIDKVMVANNRPIVRWGEAGAAMLYVYNTLTVNGAIGTEVTITDQFGDDAVLFEISGTGRPGNELANPVTIGATGEESFYVKTRRAQKGEYVGTSTDTSVSIWIDYYPFVVKFSLDNYQDQEITLNDFYLKSTLIMEQILLMLSIDSVDITDATTIGGEDGALAVTASGGDEDYEYSLDGVDYQESNTFEGLPAGEYTVYVKDGTEEITTFDVEVSVKYSLNIQTDQENIQ